MLTSSSDTLFDQDFLRRLESLNLISKNLLSGQLKGERRTTKTGSGLEFADHRAYIAGGDTRHLDWRAYLRLNRLILRIFQEETDLSIYIFIDSSRSMCALDPDKFRQARRLTAAFAYIGLANLDQVSLLSYASSVTGQVSPRRGKNQIWPILRFLESLDPGAETCLKVALSQFFSSPRRKGLVVIVSDFLDANGFQESLGILQRLGHDLLAIHILSPADSHPILPAEEVVLIDSEDRSRQQLRGGQSILADYQKEFEIFREELKSYCFERRWTYAAASTELPFDELILRIFRPEELLT